MNRAVAFVPVRLSSARLPAKHLQPIGERTLLAWVGWRLAQAGVFADRVVCAPDEPASAELAAAVAPANLSLYLHPGDPNDVVGRLVAAAGRFRADICVLASGDCPLLEPASLAGLVGCLADRAGDLAVIGCRDGRPAVHEGIQVARREVWELADRHSDSPPLREHQFPVLGRRPELFARFRQVVWLDRPEFYRHRHRLSVDTPADLTFMNTVHDRLLARGRPFDLAGVLDELDGDPGLRAINADVHQKGLFEPDRRVWLWLAPGRAADPAWVDWALELAGVLTRRFAAGVTLVAGDPACRARAMAAHLRVRDVWAAERPPQPSGPVILLSDPGPAGPAEQAVADWAGDSLVLVGGPPPGGPGRRAPGGPGRDPGQTAVEVFRS